MVRYRVMTPRAAMLAAVLALATGGCLSVADPVASGGNGGSGAHSSSGGSTAAGGTFPGSGSTGGSGTGGGSGSENCLNGIDDDGDNAIDCADPDCMPNYECVDLPSGWEAKLTTTTAWSASLPGPAPCPGSDAPVRYFEGPAGPADCGSCSCGSLTASCSDTPINCALGNLTCSAASAFSVSTCSNFVPPSNKQISCVLGLTQVSGGGCPPSTAALSNPDPWQSVRDACVLNAGGCSAKRVCAPKQPGPASAACITVKGTPTCPADWPQAIDVFDAGNDTRACSDCTCSVSSAICDADTFNLMTMTGCVDFGPYPTFGGTTCVSYALTTGTTWSIQRVPATNKNATGSCTPAGGAPSGSMTPQSKTTLCCR